MNREETKRAAEVMLHYANGGEVQRTTRRQPEHWLEMTDYNYPDGPQWDWRSAMYRKKPQPVEMSVWIVAASGHDGKPKVWGTFASEHMAIEYAKQLNMPRQIVRLTGTYTEDTP